MRRMGKKYRINEDRVHFTLSIPPETMQLARDYYQIDDCGNISEYIGKAIEFYSGYVANRKTPNYLPTIVISTLKNILACSDDRRGAQLYRLNCPCCSILLLPPIIFPKRKCGNFVNHARKK